MEVAYSKKFLKDLALIPAKYRSEIEVFVFEKLPEANTLSDLKKFEKMQGYDGCYKARFGSYRLGIIVRNDVVQLKRVMNRKEIYRYFP